MKIGVCPGSFDPVTLGHIDIIQRATKIFDQVIVAVLNNPSKQTSFTVRERVELLKRATAHIPQVKVDFFEGLLADYTKLCGASAIVKGLRAVSDFEYEFQMALTNQKLNKKLETVFLTTSADNMFLSSSVVKDIARFGGDISALVPSCILNEIQLRLCNKIYDMGEEINESSNC